MRKLIILTESQVKTVVNNIVNEQATSNVGKVISKRDRKLNRKYIDAFNVLYTQMFRNYIPNPETVDLVEFRKSPNQSYFAIRSYRQNDLSSFVDMFSNGRYKMYSNGTLSSSGVMGLMNDEIQFRDGTTDEIIGNLSDVNNGSFTTTKKDGKNKSNQDIGANPNSPDKDKSTSKNPDTSQKELSSKNCKYNKGTENFQKFIVDKFPDTFGKMIGGLDGVDGCWGQKTKKMWESFCEVNKEKYPSICKNYTGATKQKTDEPVNQPTVNPSNPSPEQNKSVESPAGETPVVSPSDKPDGDTELGMGKYPGHMNYPSPQGDTPTETTTQPSIEAGNQVYFNNVGFYKDPNNESRYIQVPGKNLYYYNDNTLRWVGRPPNQTDLDNLNAYLKSIGFIYNQNKSKEERNKKGNIKYVWKKTK